MVEKLSRFVEAFSRQRSAKPKPACGATTEDTEEKPDDTERSPFSGARHSEMFDWLGFVIPPMTGPSSRGNRSEVVLFRPYLAFPSDLARRQLAPAKKSGLTKLEWM